MIWKNNIYEKKNNALFFKNTLFKEDFYRLVGS